MSKSIEEAIKELKAHITVYQVIRRRLAHKVITLEDLQEENEILNQINKNLLNEVNEAIKDSKIPRDGVER